MKGSPALVALWAAFPTASNLYSSFYTFVLVLPSFKDFREDCVNSVRITRDFLEIVCFPVEIVYLIFGIITLGNPNFFAVDLSYNIKRNLILGFLQRELFLLLKIGTKGKPLPR